MLGPLPNESRRVRSQVGLKEGFAIAWFCGKAGQCAEGAAICLDFLGLLQVAMAGEVLDEDDI